MPAPIFKGPLFPARKARQRTLTALPVARGVVNEQDFLAVRAERPTRDEVVAGIRTGKTFTAMGVPAHFEEETEEIKDEHNQRRTDC